MGTAIENRGSLPPEVMADKPGYMETGVDIIKNDCILTRENNFPTSAEDWKALDIIADVDKAIAEKSREERKRMVALMLEMRAEHREKIKQRRNERIFNLVMTVALCAEIAVALIRII